MVELLELVQFGGVGLAFFAMYILYDLVKAKKNGKNGNGNGDGKLTINNHLQLSEINYLLTQNVNALNRVSDKLDKACENLSGVSTNLTKGIDHLENRLEGLEVKIDMIKR